MQTFLPYPNFAVSAMCLDRQRLGKQRVEARQIQTTLQRGGGWERHPAVRMWSGYVTALMLYGDCVIREWVRRGYQNTMPLMMGVEEPYVGEIEMPWWLGSEDLHASHRAALLEKDQEWYGQFGWSEEPSVEYAWPVRGDEE